MNDKLNDISDADRVNFWKLRYFETQAACEAFLLENYGEDVVLSWFEKIGETTAKGLTTDNNNSESKIQVCIDRIVKHFKVYDSVVELSKVSPNVYKIDNQRCGLLNYRKLAEKRGVKLVLDLPCKYCKRMHSATVQTLLKDAQVDFECDSEGCKWTINMERQKSE